MSISPLQNQDVEAFADNSPVMMWSSDETGARNWFNQSWRSFRGRTNEQEAGFGWTEGVHPLDLARALDVSRRALDKRESFEVEYRLLRHDGTYSWILARGNPVHQADAFIGYLGCCFDVTDHRLNESKLVDSLVERDALLREVHHRVKNNLQTLMALMRFMRRSATEDGREVLDILNMRLVTMALVQKHLHSTDTLIQVSTMGMLAAIVPELSEMGIGMDLKLVPNEGDLVLPGQATAYLGLAVSEAILLFSHGRFETCRISLEQAGHMRSIVVSGEGGTLDATQALLGQRLVRQYARGAGATVDIDHESETSRIRLGFGA